MTLNPMAVIGALMLVTGLFAVILLDAAKRRHR